MINNVKNAQKTTLIKTDLYNSESPQCYDMIVFCHLRWQFVYQRPQHIISRFSSTMKVLFVEEPVILDNAKGNSGNLIVVTKTLHVLQPNVKDIESIATVLPGYVKNKTIPIGWFYCRPNVSGIGWL